MRYSASVFWKICKITSVSVALLCGSGWQAVYAKALHTANTRPETQGALIVNPDAPSTYVVQKGDTLWDIASKFLHTPWRWPEIWDKNQEYKNPHLIYPGDVLRLSYVNNQPVLTVNGVPNAPPAVEMHSTYDSEGRLQPRIRIERRGSGEPIANLAPFMVWPQVLDLGSIKSAPYILSSQDDHALITSNDTIYIKNMPPLPTGHRSAIYHENKPLIHPRTKQLLGYEVSYAGYARIEHSDRITTATVLDSKREIHEGDRLFIPNNDENTLNNVPIKAPSVQIKGEVVSLFDSGEISGSFMIAAIDQGLRNHVQIGDTLAVYAAGRMVLDPVAKQRVGNMQAPVYEKLPSEKIANIVIYNVASDNLSYGLIMDATREVKAGDVVVNP